MNVNTLMQLFILNNLVFFCALALLIDMSSSLLFFMIGLEVVYLSLISGFACLSTVSFYAVAGVFALFLVGIAAAEAVIGFYLVVLLFIQKQSLSFVKCIQLKG